MKHLFDQDEINMNLAKQVLRLNEDRFHLFVSQAKDFAFFLMDSDGQIVAWSEGAKRLKGYEEQEILGQHFSCFYLKEQQEKNKMQNDLAAVIKNGQIEEEGWRLKKSGERFWAKVIITRMNDKNGKIIGYANVTFNLTERKNEEAILLKFYGDLTRAFEEKTADLAAALVARDEFLMIASHELKTPLTSLKLRLQMGQRNLRSKINKIPTIEDLDKFYTQSLGQVDSLVKLIDELLEVSRHQSGQFTLNKEEVNFSILVEKVTARFIENKNIAMKIVPDIYLLGDSYRMEQVLANLLKNAIKHAPDSPVEVVLNLSPDHKYVRLIVKDEGPGIHTNAQEKIFQRFERLGSYKHVGGLGLGLFMVKKIVEGHNGTITLLSTPGEGATFIVSLPAQISV
jgi:PAS domain S-box-containing protein